MNDSAGIVFLLFATGAIAGMVDAIAGGGGLITIPVLLGAGLPPHLALGTNKFQASFGSFTASAHYMHHGIVNMRDAAPGIVWTLIGSVAGAWSVRYIEPGVLDKIIPGLLLGVLIYTVLAPKLGGVDATPRMSGRSFFALGGLLLGFYDGFFGPGVGSFWAFALVLLRGFNLQTATGYTKVMNFVSNVASLAVFLLGGFVQYVAGVSMAAGQIVGARIGAGLVIKKGAEFIRPVYIGIVFLTIVKLAYDRLF